MLRCKQRTTRALDIQHTSSQYALAKLKVTSSSYYVINLLSKLPTNIGCMHFIRLRSLNSIPEGKMKFTFSHFGKAFFCQTKQIKTTEKKNRQTK